MVFKFQINVITKLKRASYGLINSRDIKYD